MQRISPKCIVHFRTSFLKFKKTVDEIRQKQKLPISVLLALEKECCTCGKPQAEPVDIDSIEQRINVLNLIEEKKPTYQRKDPDGYVLLHFLTYASSTDCKLKISRFIGAKGSRFRYIESKYNVKIHIVNEKSERFLKQYVNNLKVKNRYNFSGNTICLVLTSYNKLGDRKNLINKAKLELLDIWKLLPVQKRSTRRKYDDTNKQYNDDEKDTRWKQIKYRNRK